MILALLPCAVHAGMPSPMVEVALRVNLSKEDNIFYSQLFKYIIYANCKYRHQAQEPNQTVTGIESAYDLQIKLLKITADEENLQLHRLQRYFTGLKLQCILLKKTDDTTSTTPASKIIMDINFLRDSPPQSINYSDTESFKLNVTTESFKLCTLSLEK